MSFLCSAKCDELAKVKSDKQASAEGSAVSDAYKAALLQRLTCLLGANSKTNPYALPFLTRRFVIIDGQKATQRVDAEADNARLNHLEAEIARLNGENLRLSAETANNQNTNVGPIQNLLVCISETLCCGDTALAFCVCPERPNS